jgi:uncharacterized membrane protein HdeD (DUF308 family)
MEHGRVRSIIAILIIGVFMFITGFLAIYPLVTNQQVQLSAYADFFAKTSGVYTGIIGVIVGYYFGKAQDSIKKEEVKKQTPESVV